MAGKKGKKLEIEEGHGGRGLVDWGRGCMIKVFLGGRGGGREGYGIIFYHSHFPSVLVFCNVTLSLILQGLLDPGWSTFSPIQFSFT